MTGCSWRIRLTKHISQSLKIFQDLVDLEQNLQNEDLFANIVFDPAENEQSKVETFRTLLATFGRSASPSPCPKPRWERDLGVGGVRIRPPPLRLLIVAAA